MIEIRKVNLLLDEVVASNCTIHAERLDDKQWSIEIVDAAKNSLSLEVNGKLTVRYSLTRDAEHRNEAVLDGDVCPECGGYYNQSVCEVCGFH